MHFAPRYEYIPPRTHFFLLPSSFFSLEDERIPKYQWRAEPEDARYISLTILFRRVDVWLFGFLAFFCALEEMAAIASAAATAAAGGDGKKKEEEKGKTAPPHSTHSTTCTRSYRVDGGENATSPRMRLLLRPIDANNVGTLRVLNRVILPVQYKDKFYRDVVGYPEEVRQMAYKGDNVVGAVCCRVEDHPSGEGKRLYVMTLGVLAAYRGYQVGTQLLEHVLDHAAKKMPNVKSVYLHVHTINEDAIKFYSKFGFSITETLPDYYTRVEPPSCHVLERENVPDPEEDEGDSKSGKSSSDKNKA